MDAEVGMVATIVYDERIRARDIVISLWGITPILLYAIILLVVK